MCMKQKLVPGGILEPLSGHAFLFFGTNNKTVVVKLFVAKRDQLKGVFWALVRAPVCLG